MVKALVLCAGRGSRLRPLTHTRAKASVPVAGRPVLGHILSYLHRHGFTDVGVVIGTHQGELRSLPDAHNGQKVSFIVQRRPLGIAHAVRRARRFLGAEPFLLYLGDNLTDEDLVPAVDLFAAASPAAVILGRQVPNPQAFGVAEVSGNRVTRVVEKPSQPPSDLAIAGIYLFSPAVHDAIASLRPSARGEYEITDAIAGLLDVGAPVLHHRMTGWWQDMGSIEGTLAANAYVLDQIQPDIDPTAVLGDVQLQGRVRIGPGVVLERVRLRGPLDIGAGARLRDAYVGPYSSLGENVVIEETSIENSILLPGCRLQGAPFHLEGCLLGSGVTVRTRTGHAVSLHMGDDASLMIPPGPN